MQIRPAPEMPLPPRRSPLRRAAPAAIALAVLAALAAGYTGWWLTAAADFRNGVLAWIAQRRADGVRIEHGPPARSGFPLSLAVRFPDVDAALPDADWRWQAERVRVAAPLLGRRTLTVSLDGTQTLVWGSDDGGNGAGDARRWTGRAETLALELAPGGGADARLMARRLAMTTAGDDAGVGDLDLTLRRATPDSDPDTAGSMTLAAAGLRLPAAAATPLGRDVARLDLAVRLTGTTTLPLTPPAIAAWRDDGGVVEIDRLAADYGPLTLQADGTLALDEEGQPIGALTTHIDGWEAGLDSLAAARTIPAHTAAAAKILLRGLARGDAERGGTLSAPLSLQDRTLSVGPVPLLRFQPVHWLQPPAR